MTAAARPQQLPLALPHRPAHGRHDFLIAPSNEDAVGWIDRWPAWPAPALVLHGPAACGKTHLGAVWRERTQARTVSSARLGAESAADIFSDGAPLFIDALDPAIGDRAAETALFHLYNLAREHQSTLLLALRNPPGRLNFALPDLASRLRAAPAVGIDAPDETLLGAVLVKMFADRQINITDDILAYVLQRMERSFAAASDLVEKTDRLALAEKRAVTLPLVRQILISQSTQD